MDPAPAHSGSRVVLIGSLPPPIGGVSSHVLRLAAALRGRGVASLVLDLYPDPRKRPFGSWHRISPYRSRLLALIWACLSLRGGDIVHLHLSRVSGAVAAIPVLWLAPGRRLIVTLHDGDQQLILSGAGAFARWLTGILLPRLSRLVVLSELQEAFYRSLGVSGDRMVRWTKAPPLSVQPDETELPSALRGLRPIERGGESVVLVTSGYLAPSYRFELALDLHRALLERGPSQLVLCFYGQDDPAYATRIREAAAATPFVTVVETLSPAGFLALLARTSIYLRPSLIDSYGLAISEALDVGARALASDVCARDPRCMVFATGDKAEFMRKGIAMAQGHAEAPPGGGADSNDLEFVLDTYRF